MGTKCKECGCPVIDNDYCALCAVGINCNQGGLMRMSNDEIKAWFAAHAAELDPVIESEKIDVDAEGNEAHLISYDDECEYSSGRAVSNKVRESDDDSVLPMQSDMPAIKVCDVCGVEVEDAEGAECPECGNYALERDGDVFTAIYAAHQETIPTGTLPDCGRSSFYEEGMFPNQVYVPEHGFATRQELQSLEHIEKKWDVQDLEVFKANIAKRKAMKAMAKRLVDGYSKKIVECESQAEANEFINKAIDVFHYILGKNGLSYLFPAVRVLNPSAKVDAKYLEIMENLAVIEKEIKYYNFAVSSGVMPEYAAESILKDLNNKAKALRSNLGVKLNSELYKRIRVVLFNAWKATQVNIFEAALNKVQGLIDTKVSKVDQVFILENAGLTLDEVKMALAHARFLLRKSNNAVLPVHIYYALRNMEAKLSA